VLAPVAPAERVDRVAAGEPPRAIVASKEFRNLAWAECIPKPPRSLDLRQS
jgi:hypothetical protein